MGYIYILYIIYMYIYKYPNKTQLRLGIMFWADLNHQQSPGKVRPLFGRVSPNPNPIFPGFGRDQIWTPSMATILG